MGLLHIFLHVGFKMRCTLIIREMQIKTTMRYYLTPVRRATIKKSTSNPLTLLVGMQTGTVTMENSVEIPLKTGTRTAIRPSNSTAGHTHQGN